MINFSSFHSSFVNDLELISALHRGETSTSTSNNDGVFESADAVRIVVSVTATISIVFAIAFATLNAISKLWNLRGQNFVHVSYQVTNLCVNLFLGCYGIYIYNFAIPEKSELLITERITGFSHHSIFAFLQIGYNLWSLPVGCFLVKESTAMLCHHVATIFVSLFSVYCNCGFRYYQPFFFGLVEISSVPLAIMNFCKSNKEWTKQHCPNLGEMIRPIFAAMFLTTRVFMWTPNMYDVLRSTMMLFWTSQSVSSKVALGFFGLACVFLTSLQYFWGLLITKSIIKAICGLKLKRVKEVKVN